MSSRTRIRRGPAVVSALAAAALTAAGITLIPSANAATTAFPKGPAPSNSSIEAVRGPFATAQSSVSRATVSGFGGGDIYYPTDTSSGTFGAVVIAPGYTASKSSMAWIAPRIASQGFVVFNIDTLTTSDQPASRGRQLLAAADYLTGRSSVRTRIDATRVAVVGHSMGGGGTLEAAASRPSLQAAIPLTPWNLTKSWSRNTVPTLIVGAENDSIASVRSHSEPFYDSLPAAPGKAYLELNNASHFAPNSSNTTIAKFSIAWLKLFVDNDTRYQQFVCPGPGTGLAVQEYRNTCANFAV
ncbi:alpha/beta hydrolase family protein [Actinoplanes aureus]|uniref:Dienelactone hydrolase family protein n=1 Tax=Actinoplanes aureus TaxID=2792083 RepID=A0A931C6E6_9ACTN|nr:dienelactone hydrolase family protein [Actinoplanes aureus]MBG0564275.1 dienelactone hydrolase family protein [Actinoplanes aureus]